MKKEKLQNWRFDAKRERNSLLTSLFFYKICVGFNLPMRNLNRLDWRQILRQFICFNLPMRNLNVIDTTGFVGRDGFQSANEEFKLSSIGNRTSSCTKFQSANEEFKPSST